MKFAVPMNCKNRMVVNADPIIKPLRELTRTIDAVKVLVIKKSTKKISTTPPFVGSAPRKRLKILIQSATVIMNVGAKLFLLSTCCFHLFFIILTYSNGDL